MKPKKQEKRKGLIEMYSSFLKTRRSSVSLGTHKAYNIIVGRLQKFEAAHGKLWIDAYDQVPTNLLERVRDAFLFSCYTGLRYGDLHGLTSNEIKNEASYSYIELVPKKSRSRMKEAKSVQVPIPAFALEILRKYDGSLRSLPVLSNQKMNEYLKQVAELAGITVQTQTVEYQKGFPIIKYKKKFELITVHVARHTYATLSLVMGVPIEVIQKVLGHSDLKMTMRYAKIVDAYKNAVILGVWDKV
ncbi:site-specific integrase [Runella sp.]|uniref:site-specific integrase n=1 Tax=Runella sp. TaxID=1960881 RepID=UPI003D0B4829